MPLSFAVTDAGILPDRMIAALADAGAILPIYPNPTLTEREAGRISPFIPWSFEPAGLQPRKTNR